MRLDHLPGAPHLTYCTNIHPGESWDEIAAGLDAHIPAIKAAVSPAAPFGIGLRLSGAAAAELARPPSLERFRDGLDRLGAYVFTVNAFPYGPFHGAPVKERVYEPDWRSWERLDFTLTSARCLAALLPEGGYGSLSTVPGGHRAREREAGAVEAMAENLLRAAAGLARLERECGRTLALALEPEPWCLLETAEEAVRFFEERLLARGALARFRVLAEIGAARAEGLIRRHLGICYDVCHGAVAFESPAAALRRLRGAGLAVPKVQLSAALKVPAMDGRRLAWLERFDAGTYLHQVAVRTPDGGVERYPDLGPALRAYRAGAARGEWRVHCHVPVFEGAVGEAGSTQGDLAEALNALRGEAFSPHLEVETYTWDVLPAHLKTCSKAGSVARELRWVLGELGHERPGEGGPAPRDPAGGSARARAGLEPADCLDERGRRHGARRG